MKAPLVDFNYNNQTVGNDDIRSPVETRRATSLQTAYISTIVCLCEMGTQKQKKRVNYSIGSHAFEKVKCIYVSAILCFY